jgi:hypothetical protein
MAPAWVVPPDGREFYHGKLDCILNGHEESGPILTGISA